MSFPVIFVAIVATLCLSFFVSGKVDLAADPPQYGVDCSYPIHYGINKKKCPYFYDQYQKLMAGCYKYYSKKECDQSERDRLRNNLEQAPSQHNYTTIGFKKTKVPKEVWEPLIAFYNKYKSQKKIEKWYRGATIVNTWDAPSYMVSFEDRDYHGGEQVKQIVWNGMRPIIEEWTGHKLVPTSLYGIRLYTEGSILASHVDRLPLVSSCIINIDQDLDEPWPIEVYDHDGNAYNVTMEPGDAVLYESSTVLHGRPFALKGRYFANIFVHFEPVDHKEMNERDEESRRMLSPNAEPFSVRRRHGGGDDEGIVGKFRNAFSFGQKKEEINDATAVMLAASGGKIEELHRLLSKNAQLIDYTDENGWQPLHEAVRGGSLETVKYLLAHGADINAETYNGDTPLSIGKKTLSVDHKIIAHLISQGGVEEVK